MPFYVSHLYPSTVVALHTSLQAVAVWIHIHSLVTVCCVYLPPNDVVPQVDLNRLVSQLPAPFILLGDFNGHSPLWGHDDTNSRSYSKCCRSAIPKTSNSPRKLCKPWWNASCQQAKKEQRGAWGIFRRYPTTDNLIAFKRAKALARRIRRQCQRESWIKYVSSITSSTTSQQLWRKVKAANGLYREFNIPILETSTALFSSPFDVANLIGKNIC
ncbi:putative RNA-directed DNA polymerase from transposon X-element [Trichonephila clavipes]|nr:putative RNA-directed DNA polymerase from transposon X-element [Trichonephila clavipes]